MPYFLHKKKNIHYENEGSGEVVVLLHGFLENLSMWDEIADELSKTCQVIRIDLPGFGRSDCIENIDQGLLPQKWMGQKIAPIRQEAGCDVDYEWQIPVVEWWLSKYWDVKIDDDLPNPP